jgi:glucose/arabinose dehydrogenase
LPHRHHRVCRFSLTGDRIDPASEKLLWQGNDQTKLGGTKPAGHQGGAIRFGLDGKLYISLGEQTAGAPAQRLDTFQGKLLRFNADGSIPSDHDGRASHRWPHLHERRRRLALGRN